MESPSLILAFFLILPFSLAASPALDEAKTLYKQGQRDKAVTLLQEQIRKQEAQAAEYAFLGTLLALRGEEETSLWAYQKAAQLEPTFVPYLYNVAITYYHLEKWEEARLWFEKILHINSRDERAKNYLATIQEGTRQHQAHIAKLEQELEPKEKTFEEFLRVGRLYQEWQRWESAEHYFLKADSLNARAYEVKAALGQLAYRRKDYHTSLQYWEQAQAIAPSTLEAHVEAGRLYAFLGRLKEAARCWYRVKKLAQPNQPEYQEAQYYLQNLSPFLE